jgi:hypothetical protein
VAGLYLRCDPRIITSQQKAVWSPDDVEEDAALDLHAREHRLRDHEAGRGAYRSEFKSGHSYKSSDMSQRALKPCDRIHVPRSSPRTSTKNSRVRDLQQTEIKSCPRYQFTSSSS